MSKYDKNLEISYSIGTTVTIELLKFRPEIATRLYLSSRLNKDETYQMLVDMARSHHIPVITNNEKIFREISGKDNCLVICEFKKQHFDIAPTADHCVLVNPSNMGNLGTIIRCMVGFSLFDLAVVGTSCDAFDPKVVRASMGAFFHINISFYETFDEYLESNGKSRALYPFMLQATHALKDIKPSKPWSIIFGNEATGLPREFLNVGTPLLIPHNGFIDSLNLDNAAAIGIYEFTKDRN